MTSQIRGLNQTTRNANGGAVKTAESVVLDTGVKGTTTNPLNGFNETWEDIVGTVTTSNVKSLQMGANTKQTLDVSFGAINMNALAISGVNLMTSAGFTIAQMDMALNYINGEKTRIGAQLIRLDSAITNNQTSAESTFLK